MNSPQFNDWVIRTGVTAAGRLIADAENEGLDQPKRKPVSTQSIAYWRSMGIPPERAHAISKASGIPKYLLRPDLWSISDDGAHDSPEPFDERCDCHACAIWARNLYRARLADVKEALGKP